MEQNKKSSNKKMLIALTTLCVAFLFVCGAMIGVFAATAQTVNSGFKVQYSIGDNIAATVSVEHTLTGGTPAKSVNFTAATGEQVFALEPADATLSPDATEVVYTFTFKNDSEVPFTVTMTDKAVANNVIVTYDEQIAGATEVTAAYSEETGTTLDQTGTFTVAGNATVAVTITVKVNDSNKSTASYDSKTGSALSWRLEEAVA